MSSGSYKQVHAQCPFFKRMEDRERAVYCEGILDDSTISIRFRKAEDLRINTDIFCCKYYKNCEIYRMLMDTKYPDYKED